jgi:STE24 endopeptidase
MVYAWLLLFSFSLFAVWIYPTVLAPLFNKFTPLDNGELKVKIEDLAKRVAFQADGVSIMDASKRSSHGNAYFTGVFGKKKIVLFDTLVKAMNVDEITAVLAHELGHFKLNHIRIGLIRSFFSTGLMFYGMSLMMPYEKLYTSLGLNGTSSYGALIVFSLWFGLVSFLFQPFSSYLSRKNEFAADAFALQHIPKRNLLGDALLKLREKSNLMPISHPLFSRFYHSHPPLIERLSAMNYNQASNSQKGE